MKMKLMRVALFLAFATAGWGGPKIKATQQVSIRNPEFVVVCVVTRPETAALLRSLTGRVGQGTPRKAFLDIDAHLVSILYR